MDDPRESKPASASGSEPVFSQSAPIDDADAAIGGISATNSRSISVAALKKASEKALDARDHFLKAREEFRPRDEIVSKTRPRLWIVAGPNGAGKTTLARQYPFAAAMTMLEWLNPDEISKELLKD